jgi:Peptidase family M23
MRLHHILLQLLLLLGVARADLEDPRALGRACQKALESSDAEALWPKLSPEMKRVFGGTRESLKQKLDEIARLNGAEVRLAEESVQYLPDGYKYLRRVMFERGYVQYTWWIDREGMVQGMLHMTAPPDELAGEAPTKFAAYQTKTTLRLPFTNTWKVIWGGRVLRDNRHADTSDQRFAYDLSVAEGGKLYRGDGKTNSDYFTFGQAVVAPGDGKVFEALDGIDDNPPGKMNPGQTCGNHVILDHGNGEFSFLCHLQKGTVAVQTGAVVKAGQSLGKAGNSGNSSQPHLHYHLQTTPRQNDGDGLPAQFLGYLADGKKVERGEPVRGQLISPPISR